MKTVSQNSASVINPTDNNQTGKTPVPKEKSWFRKFLDKIFGF